MGRHPLPTGVSLEAGTPFRDSMVLLQPRLNLKVTQRQILTPGLVQMVSVLALNKLELKDMINAEMVENPVLEELDGTVPLLDDVARKEAAEERPAPEEPPTYEAEKKDPFEEIDFGSFFQDYLDPGYRSPESEFVERPSFENFLSKPGTLTDHLMWQLGAVPVKPGVRAAAELVIGNLNEDGYLTASEDELMAAAIGQTPEVHESQVAAPEAAEPLEQIHSTDQLEDLGAELLDSDVALGDDALPAEMAAEAQAAAVETALMERPQEVPEPQTGEVQAGENRHGGMQVVTSNEHPIAPEFTLEELRLAVTLVQTFDPSGVAAPDLRECLLAQLGYHRQVLVDGGQANGAIEVLDDATVIVREHLKLIQNKQFREIAKAMGRTLEQVETAFQYIRTLDPKPGLRYNLVEPKLIEPDVAFIRQGDDYIVVMNDEDVPQLRLNGSYKRLLSRDTAEKDVRNYVKERYKSAIQLIKNIEQRKQTILKVCYAIVGRQRDFLERGIDQLKPMMIKEVAEEIGVHPSTVSRAVANKYAHTAQGVFELRYFFSESVQGPEGGQTSLLILKRRVKKLIEDEDPSRPLTDEQITRILQSQGIKVTRRTVAKYREDMKIPSTHQRRVKK